MQLTEIRINLCPGSHHPLAVRDGSNGGHGSGNGNQNGGHPAGGGHGSRLRAFCSLTFDDTFVVRDVKLIEGNDGLFLAMPSRKLADHCPACGEKNHLRAKYCNECGRHLDESRYLAYRQGNGMSRLKLHADVAHPINARCRREIERRVVDAYWREVERSRQPGYIPPSLDAEDFDFYDLRPAKSAGGPGRMPMMARPEPAMRPVGLVQ